MQRTPRGLRLHIGLFGRRNVGKSSLLNAITRQQVSIVSEVAGTTTDPVEKPMELLPLGPVLFIDTAGIDDVGALGELRVKKTRSAFDRTDIGVIITEADTWGEFEEQILQELSRRETPVVIVLNKTDIRAPDARILARFAPPKAAGKGAGRNGRAPRLVQTAAGRGTGILDFRQALLDAAPEGFIDNPAILSDLVGPGELAVLVVPIDKEAPKGRLILPQVQSIRDLLDGDSYCMVVKERELSAALDRLNRPPKLVVTDSSCFLKVAADVPPSIPMTSFSILFARFRGDLVSQAVDTLAIERLRSGDRVLIAEACSHHPIADDIGRVKIPRWLRQFVGGELHFDVVQGHDFPEDLGQYRLLIHCGACMWNRREMLSRLVLCRAAGVPVSNYGLVIAYSLGIFERALEPFPAAREACFGASRASG
ncbi:MAG: [FeFe] hydrogenase H-cluster maturation GTPase HydF [Candidatus Brocadiaceae bacterium]|nr:[FeFe] hydrogenase H-cluster maturation GTPase HydF [Candidatus Brocadiaceae bacterium]